MGLASFAPEQLLSNPPDYPIRPEVCPKLPTVTSVDVASLAISHFRVITNKGSPMIPIYTTVELGCVPRTFDSDGLNLISKRQAARAERRGEHGERGCFGPGKGDGTGISATIRCWHTLFKSVDSLI